MDIMDWLRKQLHQEVSLLPMGSVLTWFIARNGETVNVVMFDDGMMGL